MADACPTWHRDVFDIAGQRGQFIGDRRDVQPYPNTSTGVCGATKYRLCRVG